MKSIVVPNTFIVIFILMFSTVSKGSVFSCLNILGQSKSEVEKALVHKIGDNFQEIVSSSRVLSFEGRNFTKAEFKEILSHITPKTRNVYLSYNPRIGDKELRELLIKTNGLSRLDVSFTSVSKSLVGIIHKHSPRINWLRTSLIGYRGLLKLRSLSNLSEIEIAETKVSLKFITFMLRFFRPYSLSKIVVPDTSSRQFKRLEYLAKEFAKDSSFSVVARQAGPSVYFHRQRENVKDGDSFLLKDKNAKSASKENIEVRLWGADTPETNSSNPFEVIIGTAAKHFVFNQLMYARNIEVYRAGKDDTGKFGREMFMLVVDGKNLGELLVKKGLASRYYGEKKEDLDYQSMYESSKKKKAFYDYWAKEPSLTQGFGRKLWWVLNHPMERVLVESYHKGLAKIYIQPRKPVSKSRKKK